MWEEMAEMAMHHLKPNDFVYVSGNLRSYIKADRNGNPRIWYEVENGTFYDSYFSFPAVEFGCLYIADCVGLSE